MDLDGGYGLTRESRNTRGFNSNISKVATEIKDNYPKVVKKYIKVGGEVFKNLLT